MKIFISDYHKYIALRAALVNVCNLHEVPNFEYMSNEELYNAIKGYNSPLIDALDAYFSAYDKWFQFYQERKVIENQTDTEYELDDDERLELGDLINARNDTRNKLQRQFDDLLLTYLF